MSEGLTEDQVRERVNGLVVNAGSLRALSREWGVSPSYLSDFLNSRRGPGPQILKAMGLVQHAVVRYVPGKIEGRRRRSVRGS